jgi:hypothetical protein
MIMIEDLLKNGSRMDFSQYETYGEIDKVLRNIFTNNPYYWSDSPLYLDSTGDLSNVVKLMLTNQINVYEHEFPFVEPNETKQEEIVLYNYCFGISKVRSNPLLPLVYYNAFLYMDKLNLSMHKTDNASKIMYVRKNKYNSIFEEIKKIGPRFDWHYFLNYSNSFDNIDIPLNCECGSVEAYRVELGMFYGASGYLIFPFPTDDETIGRMYYFENAI